MKKIIFLIVLGLAVGGVYRYLAQPQEPAFELEEGYHYLYDGGSLDGWRVIGGESTFSADGEDIVGRHGPGENTFLRTEKTYGDFSLKLQMRWDEPGNSGVLFRSSQRDGDGRAYGYQFELDESDRAWTGGIYDEARRGWLANLDNNQAAREAVLLDDWNDVEIEARGAVLKTWINGVPAADIIDGLTAEGFIALQVHSGDRGVMRWRRIRLREFAPVLAPGENLMTPAEWRTPDVVAMDFSDNSFSLALPQEDVWIATRRQFNDAMVRMQVPACDSPTVIQMRYREDEKGGNASFAEVKVYAGHAVARVVSHGEEHIMPRIELGDAEQHGFIGAVKADAVVLSIDEVDALRLDNAGLAERGQLRVQPARCSERFDINEFSWNSLKEQSPEPLFYQTLEAGPAPVLSPDEALAAFSIAPGFEIELVAAEPLVEDPVAMAWDEYGRLYVVELRGYMRDAYGTGSEEPVGQVVRLEDTDGDGRMDTSVVFLGELVSPRAIAVVNEGILIGEPPNLWLCELPQRESLCHNKRRLGGYATDAAAANVEHMENGLRQGMDNWLYNSKSTRQLRIEQGQLVEREGLYRGQWGITKDNYGRWLYNHNSTWLQADLFAAEDLVMPGAQTYPQGLGVNLTDPAEVFSVRVNPGVNRAYLDDTLREDGRLHRATGVSGLVAYRGEQFPPPYRNDVFVPEVAGNVVAQFALSGEGMALSATQRLYDDAKWGKRDFLGSTDERFRPVDAMNGPDGALYIIDMYRGIVQDDHFLTDELREQIFQRQLEQPIGLGRIWRVRHTEGAGRRPLPALAGADTATLVAMLSDDNGWVRDTAQRLLLDRPGQALPALRQVAAGDNTIASLHAIWTLAGRAELQRDLVMTLAVRDDPQRQVHALRAGHALLRSEDMLALQEQLDDAPEMVQMQLAFALGDHTQEAPVRERLGRLLRAGMDSPYIRQAVVRSVRGRELAFMQEYLTAQQLEKGDNASVVLSALAAGAYRTLRGDLSSVDPADTRLLPLLALAESRSGEDAWQQIAMLEGFASVAEARGFTPAQFEAAPPIFADGSISEHDPLWSARLTGRVAFTWPGDELAMGIQPLSPEQLQLLASGEAFYPKCAACHGSDGAGITGLAPPLADASWVIGPPEWLARIILQGMTGPITVADKDWDGLMPPHGHLAELDDATLAGLMTYLRRSWGNKANPVGVETAAAIRSASAGRDAPWTAAELTAVPYDRGFKRFAGKYSISFVTMTLTEKPEGLHLSVPMYGSGVMDQVSDTVFRAEAGGEKVKLEFLVEENGTVNTMLLYRNGEKIPLKRK